MFRCGCVCVNLHDPIYSTSGVQRSVDTLGQTLDSEVCPGPRAPPQKKNLNCPSIPIISIFTGLPSPAPSRPLCTPRYNKPISPPHPPYKSAIIRMYFPHVRMSIHTICNLCMIYYQYHIVTYYNVF